MLGCSAARTTCLLSTVVVIQHAHTTWLSTDDVMHTHHASWRTGGGGGAMIRVAQAGLCGGRGSCKATVYSPTNINSSSIWYHLEHERRKRSGGKIYFEVPGTHLAPAGYVATTYQPGQPGAAAIIKAGAAGIWGDTINCICT